MLPVWLPLLQLLISLSIQCFLFLFWARGLILRTMGQGWKFMPTLTRQFHTDHFLLPVCCCCPINFFVGGFFNFPPCMLPSKCFLVFLSLPVCYPFWLFLFLSPCVSLALCLFLLLLSAFFFYSGLVPCCCGLFRGFFFPFPACCPWSFFLGGFSFPPCLLPNKTFLGVFFPLPACYPFRFFFCPFTLCPFLLLFWSCVMLVYFVLDFFLVFLFPASCCPLNFFLVFLFPPSMLPD